MSVLDSAAYRSVAERLLNHLATIRTYTSFIDRSVSQQARRELELIEVGSVLRSFSKMLQPTANRSNVQIGDPIIEGYDLFTVPMHPAEWTSILFNLYSNSRKAIRRAGVSGQIQMRGYREEGRLVVEFSDNGDGISTEHRSRVFDAFFTTSSRTGFVQDEYDAPIGTGLGLKIIRDIVTGYGGEISVTEAPAGFTTCIRISLPAATEAVMEQYGL
jgi:signal transduction histidine kinase